MKENVAPSRQSLQKDKIFANALRAIQRITPTTCGRWKAVIGSPFPIHLFTILFKYVWRGLME